MDENINIIGQKNKKFKLNTILCIVGFTILISYYVLSAPLSNKDVTIHVSNGESINSVTKELASGRAVRSSFTLKVFVELLQSKNGIVSGDYLIKKGSPVFAEAIIKTAAKLSH